MAQKQKQKPQATLPIQAPPVRRALCEPSVVPGGHNGVEAARTQCADMTGAAREMCYAALYGWST